MRNMPIYNSFKWQDFKVSVKQHGIRKVLRFFPYFTGSKINLSINVEIISGNQLEFAYNWTCYHPGTDDSVMSVKEGYNSFIDNPQKKGSSEVKIGPLIYHGQYDIEVVISYPIIDGRKSPSETVVSIRTIDRDPFTINVILPIIFIVIGWVSKDYIIACFNWLLSKFN